MKCAIQFNPIVSHVIAPADRCAWMLSRVMLPDFADASLITPIPRSAIPCDLGLCRSSINQVQPQHVYLICRSLSQSCLYYLQQDVRLHPWSAIARCAPLARDHSLVLWAIPVHDCEMQHRSPTTASLSFETCNCIHLLSNHFEN